MARALLVACALCAAQAFSPAATLRPHSTRSLAAVAAQPVSRRAEAEPSMFLSLPKIAISVPTLYALMSVNEYVTHRWYQHEEFNRDHLFQRFCQYVARIVSRRPIFTPDGRRNLIKLKGGGHVEHHAETYDDMSLKKDPRWRKTKAAASLDSDTFRGTAFTWPVTGIMTMQMMPTTLPVFALLGFSLLETIAVLLPGMLVHALVWNMLHPPMHGLPEVPSSVGAPSAPLAALRNTAYFKYIYENHQGHHVLGGQCNYNVCCPLTDHLLGTYVAPRKPPRPPPPAAPRATHLSSTPLLRPPTTHSHAHTPAFVCAADVWSKKMRGVPGPDATERWGIPVEPAGVPQAPVISKGRATDADLTPTALA